MININSKCIDFILDVTITIMHNGKKNIEKDFLKIKLL